MDEMEIRAKLTADDEASPKVLALLDNVRRLKSEMAGLGKASPAVTRAMSAFGGGTVDKVRAVTRAVEELTAAQDRQAASAGRVGRAQAAVAQLRRGGSGSRAMRGVARDQERVEQAVFRAWRMREAIKRRSTDAEERERAKVEGAVMRRYRQSAAIRTRTLAVEERQRQATARASDRDARNAFSAFQAHARMKTRLWRLGETDRARQEAADRRAERAADRLRAGQRRQARQGLDRLAGAPGRMVGRLDAMAPPAVAALGAAAGAGAIRRILRVEADADAAEIDMRIASGLDARQARDLRNNWAMPKAVELGISPAQVMGGYTEATKVGIPDGAAKDFVELSQKLAASFSMPPSEINEILGTINAQQGGKGDIKALAGVGNAMVYLADKLATTPEKLVSFLQRGAGGSAALGMRQDLGLAFGAAATSLGVEAGSAGRFLDYLGGRTISMPRIAAKHGAEGRQAQQTIRDLGYGSAKGFDAKRRQDPDNFVFDLMERFSKIRNPKRKEEAIRFFAGQEWFGEMSSMVARVDVLKQSKDLALEVRKLDALGRRWELHKGKLSFLWRQITAGTNVILGTLGEELAPLARQAGAFFLAWSHDMAAGNLGVAFRRGLDGLLEGIIGRPGSLDQLMTSTFGAPGQRGNFDVEAAFGAARGFASGLRSVYDAVRAAFTGMAGALGFDTSSAESLAKFAGELIGVSVALRLAKPVLGVFGLAADGVAAFATAGKTLAAMEAAGGLSAAAAGILRLAGSLGAMIGLAEFAKAKGMLEPPKGFDGRSILEFLDPGLADRILGKRDQGAAPSTTMPEDGPHYAPAPPAGLGELAKALRKPTAYQGGDENDFRAMIHKAAFTSLGEPLEAVNANLVKLRATVEVSGLNGLRSGSPLAFGSIGGVGGGGGFVPAGPGGNQSTGSVNSFGLGRRGIMGGGGSPMGSGGAPSRSLLDFIAKSEGTKGYNTSWGNGRFMPGGVEQDLTGKSLNEVLALGRYMRSRPGSRNSSAMGRYQLVGTTIRDLMGRMHLNGSEKFDAKMQDAMASRLISDEGPAALNRWEGLKTGGRMAQARGLLAAGQIAPQPDAGATDLGGNLANLKRAGILTDEQCVTLAMASAGIRKGSGVMGANVHDWRRGMDAAAGTLQPGQAVATFLNRNGSKSDLYAGGGSGTPGAHLDHAGVFQRYLMDGTGKRIGMEIAEQFKGSGGAHLKRYMFGQGWGEGNASNYSAVMTKDGKQLGGGNPAAAIAADNAEKAKRVAAMAQPKGGVASSVPTTGADVTSNVPMPTPRPGWAVGDGGGRRPPDAPAAGSATQGGAGGVQIHVHGGSSDPEAIANKVHKRLSQTMNWRTHEVEQDV